MQDAAFCCMQEIYLNFKDKHYLRVNAWEKIFQLNGPKKQISVAILISILIDYKLKLMKRDGEGHFIFIQGKIRQDELSILNICDPNTRAPTIVTEILLTLKSYMKPHVNSGRLQHITFTSGELCQTETEQKNMETNRCYDSNGLTKHLQNISPKHKRIYLLIRNSWNIL